MDDDAASSLDDDEVRTSDEDWIGQVATELPCELYTLQYPQPLPLACTTPLTRTRPLKHPCMVSVYKYLTTSSAGRHPSIPAELGTPPRFHTAASQ